MSRIHILEREQRIGLPIEEAFEFFGEARNLEAITPPWLGFQLTKPPAQMGAGALISYRLKLHGMPVRWQTKITVWDAPRRFVDVQISGPYTLWEHTHSFEPDGPDAVIIRDRVRYSLPLGPLGELAHRLFVRRDVDRIFEFRRQAVVQHMAAAA
jgi:ligand-binding SRPBCC domain-containing protein